jgi:prepilin-type N-terminal cleavage/methylation domain-containing protein
MNAYVPLGIDHSRKSLRPAFTLVEVLVSVIVVAIMAAVVIPVIFGRINDSSIRRKATTLGVLAQAIMTYHDNVGMWPKTLTELTTKPVAGTDLNICSGAMANKDVGRWYGPYLATPVPSAGLVIDKDVILAPLVYQSATNLQIQVQYPDADTRTQIDAMLDGDGSATTGVIRWSGTDPTMIMTYNLPIVGC